MKSSNAGNWLQIGANISLLVGIILVGLQIKQSNDIAFASLASIAYQQETDRTLKNMGENPSAVWAKMIDDPHSLNTEELLVVTSGVDWTLSMFTRNNRLEQIGIFDDNWRKTVLPGNARLFASYPVTKEYLLSIQARDPWLEEMQELVRGHPEGDPESFLRFLENWKKYKLEDSK